MANQFQLGACSKNRIGWRTIILAFAFGLMVLWLGALAPRVTDAAPPSQLPQKLCATLLPPGAQIKQDGTTTCTAWYGLGDIDFEIAAGCHSMGVLAATCDHDAMVAEGKRLLQTYQCGAPSMKNQGTCSSSDLGDVGYQYEHSYKHNDGTQVYSYGIYFQRSCYFVSAVMSEQNQAAASSLKNQMLTLARQVDAKIKTMPRCGPAQQQPTVPSRLVVGIGGKYDESKDIVDVTAGVENRPNVGIGDGTYEWTLDGKIVKQGKELKTIQLSTAELAAGKHEIVVKVTDNINKITGGATFTFEKKKAGPAATQPPAQPSVAKPPASASGTISIQTSSGTKTVKPGDAKTQQQVARGDKVSLKATCENLAALLALFAFAEDDTRTGEMFGMNAAAIAIAMQKLNCLDLLSEPQPKKFAMAKSPVTLGLPVLAMPDAAVQLEVELTQGPLHVEMAHAKVALEVATATSVVTSVGKNNFDVQYSPKTGNTIIAARQGNVSIQPQNNRLAPVTLRAGQMVTVTQSSISPVAAIPTSGDPVLGFALLALCGGLLCLGVLVLFGGILLLVRSRRKPTSPVASPQSTALPAQSVPTSSGRPTNLPE